MNDTTKRETADEETQGDEPTDDLDLAGPTEAPLVGHGADAGLPLETVFDILRNERRQHVLAYLAVDDDDTVQIGDLAEHIAAIENDLPINALTSQQRKRVYVALYQCHLPKMTSANVVSFDKDRGTVTISENLDQLRPYLDVQPDEPDVDPGTPLHYVLLAVAGVVAYLVAALLETGGVVAGGVVLLAGFVTFAAIHYAK